MWRCLGACATVYLLGANFFDEPLLNPFLATASDAHESTALQADVARFAAWPGETPSARQRRLCSDILPKGEVLGFQIRDCDFRITPLAKRFFELQTEVFANCSFEWEETRGQDLPRAIKEPVWRCTDARFSASQGAPLQAAPGIKGALAGHAHVYTADGAKWFGLDGLDYFIFKLYFPNKRGGVYMDVGGFDGVDNSNTLAMHAFFGWRGYIFEPTSCVERLRNNRGAGAESIQGGLCPTRTHWTSATYGNCKGMRVECLPMRGWTEKFHEPELAFDFMQIDVEGAEMDILRAIDFSTLKASVLLIEWRPKDAYERRDYLAKFGFTCFMVEGYKQKPSDVQWGGDEVCWNPSHLASSRVGTS